MAAHDLPAALALAQAELDANPEQVELWQLWLDTKVAAGELGSARRSHDSIQSIFSLPTDRFRIFANSFFCESLCLFYDYQQT